MIKFIPASQVQLCTIKTYQSAIKRPSLPPSASGILTVKGTDNSALQSGHTIVFFTGTVRIGTSAANPAALSESVEPDCNVRAASVPSVAKLPNPLPSPELPLQQTPTHSTPHSKHHCPCPHPGNRRTSDDFDRSRSRQIKHVCSE